MYRGRATWHALIVFAQHEHYLTRASPKRTLIVGIVLPMARVSIVRWNLNEAGGKHLV